MRRWFSCLIAVMVLLVPITAANATEHGAAGDESVFSVQVPTNIDFIIDPLELAGLGQVYSKDFSIVNHSNTDVWFVLTEFQVIFAEDTHIEPLAEPVDFSAGLADDRKAIYLEVGFGNADGAHFILTDAGATPPPILLSAAGQDGDSCAMYISGSVSLYPAEEWRSGDVRIQLVYQLEAPVPEAPAMSGRAIPKEDAEDNGAPGETAATPPPAATPVPGNTAEGAEGAEDTSGEPVAAEPPAPTPTPNPEGAGNETQKAE